MGRTIFFNSRAIKKPGAYSQIVSGVKNSNFASLSYSGLLVIDTGSGAGWGCGAGIAGTLKNKAEAIQTFTALPDFKSEVTGGKWWKVADSLFLPNGTRSGGVTSIDYVRACETTPAEITLGFANGNVVLQTTDEGVVANGVRNDVLASDVCTVTNAGANADTITLKVGALTLGSYTVKTSDTIALVVTGLYDACVALAATTGYSFSDKTGTTFKYTAPINTGATGNSLVPSIVKTGTVAATVGSTLLGGVTGTKVVKGYAAKLIAGSLDNTKYQLVFTKGNWRGDDDLNIESGKSNFKTFLLSGEDILGYTPEFSNLSELQAWFSSDAKFKEWFKVKTFTITTTGAVVAGDLTNLASAQKAIGGTEDYQPEHVDLAFEYLNNNYSSFILLDNYGLQANSAANLKIAAWNTLQARFAKQIYVAVGNNEEDFKGDSTDSCELAVYYDNQTASVVHGGVGFTVSGGGISEYNSFVHAALLLGREAGLAPQVPLTQKQIGIQKLTHKLSSKQEDQAIDAGVLTTILDSDYDPARYVCLNGTNSLQNNTANPPINQDNTTYSKQLFRIISQLNKEITINAKRRFYGDVNGVNRFTASASTVEAFVVDYLKTKTIKADVDNLIVSFRNVIVKIEGDTISATYEFEPNFEVKFMLFTGVVIDPTIG